jgi:hypothetical protein
MKKLYKVIVMLIFALILLIPATAFGQLSRGSIENALSTDENENCEYLSIQDGVDTPMRFTLTYPSTPNVIPSIKGTDPQSLFASDFNNQGFFFATNSTDLFTIEIHIDYDSTSNESRNFLYEIFTNDNMMNQVGNWNTDRNNFCKIIEFNTAPAPHIMTDEEIINTIAGYEKEQHEVTHLKQDQTNDMISIIVIAVTSVGLLFIIILLFMKLSKSKDTANSILVSKQFGKMTLKFADAIKLMRVSTEYQDTKLDYILDKIERGLRDITITAFNNKNDMKEFIDSLPKPETKQVDKLPEPLPVSKDEQKSLSLNLLKMVNSNDKPVDKTLAKKVDADTNDKVTKGMTMFEKLKEKSLSQLGIKDKTETKSVEDLQKELEKNTTQELYDINATMFKTISKYNNDKDFKIRYDMIISILKDRASKK